MAYIINPASDPLSIPERQYATGSEVKFTTFTSCIGVLAMVGTTQLIGIHLSIYDGPDIITVGDLTQVINLVQQGSTQIKVIGQISAWEGSVKVVYDSLLAQLNLKSTDVETYPFQDGVYGGKVDNGEIEITF